MVFSCRSEILPSERLRLIVDLLLAKGRGISSTFSACGESTSIRLACQYPEPLGIFSVDERVSIACEYEVPYSEEERYVPTSLVRSFCERVSRVLACVHFWTPVETDYGTVELRYSSSVSCTRRPEGKIVKGLAWKYDSWLNFNDVHANIPTEVRDSAIRAFMPKALSALGIDQHVSIQGHGNDSRLVSDGTYEVLTGQSNPSCVNIENLASLDEAISLQTNLFSNLASRKDKLTFFSWMREAEYNVFKQEYGSLIRPWTIAFYGRLHDWVKPFASIEELPSDAPKEIPIFYQWDSDLKLFTMGRILRTPEGLRLLVSTNRTDAKKLAKRMKDATGVKFEPVEYGASF